MSPDFEALRDEARRLPTIPTHCADLLADHWSAPFVDPDVSYDRETGLAVATWWRQELLLDLRHDPDCLRVSDLADLGRDLVRCEDSTRWRKWRTRCAKCSTLFERLSGLTGLAL